MPRAQAVTLLLLALHGISTFAATLPSNISSLSDTISPDAVSLPILNVSPNVGEYSDCFNPATPRRGLYPAKLDDCLGAVHTLSHIKDPWRRVIFARRKRIGFTLPKVVRNGTCVISIDVMNDADSDIMWPQIVYTKAKEIALECTQGDFRFGGRAKTGPKMVVDVLVFGRVWPLEDGAVEPIASESAVIVAEERLTSRDSSSQYKPPPRTMAPSGIDKKGHDSNLSLNDLRLGAELKCYDPPLPRERIWPIDVSDCEMATSAFVGSRPLSQKYTFSREPIATKYYYHLPTTNSYRSCVVHLDMNNDDDQDTVKLATVEATAWVLAHKCCGEEKPAQQYGGWGTVNTGSQGLINVWVYGRLWPPRVGPTNVTALTLARPASLIDSD